MLDRKHHIQTSNPGAELNFMIKTLTFHDQNPSQRDKR